MRKPLLKLRRELATGLWPAISHERAPLWKDGRNVVFTSRGVETVPGWLSAFTPVGTAPVRGMAQQRRSDLAQRLFWGDPANIYMWDAVNVSTVGTGYTGSQDETVTQPATVWSFVVWGDWVLATNGVDKPQIYQGTSFAAMDTLTTMPFTTAEIFVKLKYHVIALNTSNGFNMIEWSDTGDPLTWTPATNNSAGNLLVRDLEGPIIAAAPLGDRLALYARDSMHLLSYVGPPYTFGYQPALNGIGAISKQAVIPVGRYNYGMDRHGFYRTDGVSFERIDTPALREWLLARVNFDQGSKICGYHSEALESVIWWYPTTGAEPDEGVVYNYRTGAWSVLGFGRTSAIERQVFKWPVAADSSGKVYFHENGTNADGSPLSCWIETVMSDLGEAELIKHVSGVRAEGDLLNLSVEARTADNVDAAPTIAASGSAPDGMNVLDMRIAGRMIGLKLSGNAYWRVEALDVYGTVGGER